ncbi:MAG: hypothetical protein ACREPB_00300 [Arenimonas sp.]
MNEQAKKFIDFINADSTLSKMIDKGKGVFEIAFVSRLFAESKKCRANENENNLLLNAARSLVEEHRKDFDGYCKRSSPRFHFDLRLQDCEKIASEIVALIDGSYYVKQLVMTWLYNCRDELFDEVIYKEHFEGFTIEEHPLQTFVYWLDYIENLKGLSEYQNWFAIKRSLTNLLRVGNAIFRRSEWQNKVSTI